MAIKPILFNSDMVRAILDGRKTVTRRVVKPQPTKNNKPFISDTLGFKTLWYGDDYYKFPYQMGDILYVRETWAKLSDWIDVDPDVGVFDGYIYKADWDNNAKKTERPKWTPSIHMPKEAARIFLRVTNVSVAKLQDITQDEAIKEGVTRLYDDFTAEEYDRFICTTGKDVHKKQSDWGFTNYLWHGNCGLKKISPRKIDNWIYQYSSYDSARDSFSSLWESTVSCKDEDKYGWYANPFVWIISFERTEKPENF